MSQADTERANARLAAAAAALAEHEQLVASRARVVHDVGGWNTQVEHLHRELARERHEVEVQESGLLGFFYALVGDERLSQAQREAAEAAARLAEATASRDQLAAYLAGLDVRLAGQQHADLIAAFQAARGEKEEALLLSPGPTAQTLQDLAVRVEAIDIELVPLEESVTAGEAALGRVGAVIGTLDGTAPPFGGASARGHAASRERARDTELQQADARGMAGAAQASITVFQRTIEGLSMSDDETAGFATLVDPADRAPFVDAWIRALASKGDRTARLAAARVTMVERYDRLRAQLGPIAARRDALAARRSGLIAQREALIHG